MNGTLYLCATPIGNLGDITMRCLETLKSVDLIAAEDTRHTLGLLNHFGIEKPMVSYFEHNRRERGEQLLEELKAGKSIALVTDAGTPAISDPGEDLVLLCGMHDIPIVPIPGAVAGICGLISSGLPTGRFCFEGFLPMNQGGRKERLEEIKYERRTLIFYEAPHKLCHTLKDMLSYFGDRKITICREMTKVHEEIRRTTLSEANMYYQEHLPRGEFVLVVAGAEKSDADQNEWERLSLKEHVAIYTEQGMDEKEALKRAAKERGISKRDAYSALKIKENE